MNDKANGSIGDESLPPSLLIARYYFPPQVGGISTMMARVMTEVAPRRICCLAGCQGTRFIDTPRGPGRVYRAAVPFMLPTPFDTIALASTLFAIKVSHRIRALVLATIGEGYVGLLARQLFGAPFVVFAHGNEVLSLRDSPWPRALESLRVASTIMANSRYTAGLLGEFGIPPERIQVIHPGCDPDEFHPVELDNARRNELLDGRGRAFVLLTVGNLVERKGHDMVLHAVAKLRKQIPDLVYVIAGSGPHEAVLRQLAGELGIADCVLFKGHVAARDLTELYAASDIFLMPSRFLAEDHDVEGFGIVYLEASACARPVIGGLSGGIADAVLDGKTGLLIEPGDVEALEQAVLRLWRNPELRTALGAAGRERIVRELTWKHFGANVRRTVNHSVAAGTGRPVRA